MNGEGEAEGQGGCRGAPTHTASEPACSLNNVVVARHSSNFFFFFFCALNRARYPWDEGGRDVHAWNAAAATATTTDADDATMRRKRSARSPRPPTETGSGSGVRKRGRGEGREEHHSMIRPTDFFVSGAISVSRWTNGKRTPSSIEWRRKVSSERERESGRPTERPSRERRRPRRRRPVRVASKSSVTFHSRPFVRSSVRPFNRPSTFRVRKSVRRSPDCVFLRFAKVHMLTKHNRATIIASPCFVRICSGAEKTTSAGRKSASSVDCVCDVCDNVISALWESRMNAVSALSPFLIFCPQQGKVHGSPYCAKAKMERGEERQLCR